MLDRFFRSAVALERLRQGVLGATLDDFAFRLDDQGYSKAVAESYLAIAGHFSRWLTLEGWRRLGSPPTR